MVKPYYRSKRAVLYRGDCLRLLPMLSRGKDAIRVDLVFADLPYGVVDCAWDSIIPLDQLWAAYLPLLKPQSPVVLTCQQPFSSQLVATSPRRLRHSWVWHKTRPTGFVNAHVAPMRAHEEVLVFGGRGYRPQGLVRVNRRRVNKPNKSGGCYASRGVLHAKNAGRHYIQRHTNFPRTVLTFAHDAKRRHPTQKPVALVEYFVRTYSHRRALVMDNVSGSGTTAVACIRSGRRFVGCERELKYCRIAAERIEAAEDLAG